MAMTEKKPEQGQKMVKIKLFKGSGKYADPRVCGSDHRACGGGAAASRDQPCGDGGARTASDRRGDDGKHDEE